MKKSEFTTVLSPDVEEKIKQAYEDIDGDPLPTILLNQQVHKECYRKYHRHYSYTSENKQSSTEISNCFSSHRLPLSDRRNYQLPSPVVSATISTNQNFQQNFVNETCVFPDFANNSSSNSSSFTADANQKLSLSSSLLPRATEENLDSTSCDKNIHLEFPYCKKSYNAGDADDLQQDFPNSTGFIGPEFSPTIKSSSVQKIHQKESFKTNIPSSTPRKEMDFYDLIDINDTNELPPTAAGNLDSTSHDNNMSSRISHNEKLYTSGDVIDIEKDLFNSTSNNNNKCSTISYNETSYNAGDITDLREDFPNSPGFVHTDFLSPIKSSSLEQIHQKESFKANILSSTATKEIDFDDLIKINITPELPSTTVENIESTSHDSNLFSTIRHSEESFITADVIDLREDFINSSSFIGSNISPSIESSFIRSTPIESSSVEKILQKKPSKTIIQSSTVRKRIDFDDLIEINDTNESSSTIIRRKKLSSRLTSRYSSRIRRQARNCTQYPLDDKRKWLLYDDSFSELCGWLENLLRGGFLVSLVMVKDKYQEILQSRNEMITEGMIRTISIRDRLHTKFKNRILFTKVNNRQGVFISLNDLSTITRSTLINSSTLDYDCTFQSSSIYKDESNVGDKEAQSKILFEAIELLRESIRENMHYLKQVQDNIKSLADFTAGLFSDCIPTLIKNVVGLLITSDGSFQRFKNNLEYSNIFNQDIYKSSEKSLKISSIAYDIINARYDSYSTPKHLLLGNELFHHVRSSHLMNIMNRFGHTCSYETITRLHKKVAHAVSELSSSDLPPTVQQQHSFAITVADNFDMNIGTLRGENSIHILNRIIIQTPVNDELKFDVNECLNDLCASVVSAVDDLNCDLSLNSNVTNPTTLITSDTANKNQPYTSYKNDSFRDTLLAYGLMKHVYDTNNFFEKLFDNQIQINLPLLAGFFATYLPNIHRPLSKITFLPPINQDPSSLTTSQSCLESTKASLIDSRYQKEAVIVVDEKIYSNCLKAKRLNEIDNKSIFLYPGDFHVMKNYMAVIWGVLNGSGIEDVLRCIYKSAAHRSIMNVHNFNYSLRCCKLIYTALSMLFFDSFIKTSLSSSSSTTTDIIEKLKEVSKSIPSDYAVANTKQQWFSTLINEIDHLKLSDVLYQWAAEQCQINQAFKFWYFVYHELLEPLIVMYMSIRLSNFDGRNAALSSMAPIFFATNHRNYARLAVQHLLDIQSCSIYLRERLERSFTVNRTNRPFSAIALDQAIECSINKYGKGRGGISGKLNPESIDIWCRSFAFRSTLSSITNEIACIERANNTIDAHVECSPFRMLQDNKDLSIIIKALLPENLFKQDNVHVRKIMNGKIIHEKIIENVVTMHERGLQKMHSFIQERYIDRTINLEKRLSDMVRFKLSDPYVSNDEQKVKKKTNNNILMTKIIQTADNTIKYICSLSCFRKLDMDSLFAHEFSPAPLSLCDSQNCNLLNQQQKAEIVRLFEKECPTEFSTKNPTINNGKWALIIDGGPLLEIRPLTRNGTIFDYAKQLLSNYIIPEFQTYDRIDIVFDSDKSKIIKSFIKRHAYENKTQQQQYDLKQNDILDSSKFHEFVHSNRAKLAGVVRFCWSQSELIDLLPVHKRLVIAGPQHEAIKLMNNKNLPLVPSSEIFDFLESDQVEADTRIFLHIYDIQTEDDSNKVNGIMVQSNDTDVFVLSIAHVKLMMLPNYFIKKFNTSTKLSTFINIKEIGKLVQNKWNITEPTVFLTLHALSGCDTTSFTRNITKVNYFLTYLSNRNRFQELIKFGDDLSVTTEPLEAAEDLLVSCYKDSRGFKSSISQTASSSCSSLTTTNSSHSAPLNYLRKSMALKYFKTSTSDICTKLPPTSNSFNQHCQRAWRQVYIWKKAFEQFDLMSYYSIDNYGYQRINDDELIIQWMTIPAAPNDISLSKCVKCTSGCQRCKCSTNNLSCTPFCGCSIDQCVNRSSIETKTQSIKTKATSALVNKGTFDDDYDEDSEDDIEMENQKDIDCEDDGEDTLESVHENDSDDSSINSSNSNYSNDDEAESNVMDMSITIDHSYCCRTSVWSSNGFNSAKKKTITSSPLQSSHVSNPFENSLSPIGPSTNVRMVLADKTNLNKIRTPARSTKRKAVNPVANENTSSRSTPSQIIPRKKKSL